MIKNKQELNLITEKYCQFFDSVIVSFLAFFTENGCNNIEVTLRCRNVNNEQSFVLLRFLDVQSWSFISSRYEATDVITEGARFELINGEWLIDFGDDPDVDLKDKLWTEETNKWVIAKEVEISYLSN